MNLPDLTGRTPLMGAARNGHERVVELLLERDDVDAGPNAEGETALYLADIRGHAGTAELLRASASPQYESEKCVACLDGEPEVELVPCGHRVLCGACAHEWFNRQLGCPVDRVLVAEIIPLEAEGAAES